MLLYKKPKSSARPWTETGVDGSSPQTLEWPLKSLQSLESSYLRGQTSRDFIILCIPCTNVCLTQSVSMMELTTLDGEWLLILKKYLYGLNECQLASLLQSRPIQFSFLSLRSTDSIDFCHSPPLVGCCCFLLPDLLCCSQFPALNFWKRSYRCMWFPSRPGNWGCYLFV